jgi:hypothetical protein
MPYTDDWLHYFVARVGRAVDDRTVSDRAFREWMMDSIDDLAAFAHARHPIADSVAQAAEADAATDHRRLFSD